MELGENRIYYGRRAHSQLTGMIYGIEGREIRVENKSVGLCFFWNLIKKCIVWVDVETNT